MEQHYSRDKLQSLGYQFYTEQKYVHALEAFDAALKRDSEWGCKPSVNLLDRRAATYQKLGNLDAALRDARKILEIEKTYVQGYLRTGSILQKMEKSDLALKIFERGLRLAPAKDENYKLLQRSHNKLTRFLSPPVAVDLFAVLPMELIEMIFSHIPFETTCLCLRVCKHWRSFLTSWSAFWTSLDLSQASRPVRAKSLRSYVHYAQGRVTEAYLRNVTLQDTKILENLVEKCKSLQSLTLATGGRLSKSLIKAAGYAGNLRYLHCSSGVPVEQTTVREVMNCCPSLEDVFWGAIIHKTGVPWKLDNYSNLRSWKCELRPDYNTPVYQLFDELCPPAKGLITLYVDCSGPGHGIILGNRNLAELVPRLRELVIKNLFVCDHHHEDINPAGAELHVELPSSLRTLKLVRTGCVSRPSWPPSSRTRLCPNADFPLISDLCIHENRGLDTRLLDQLLECMSKNRAVPLDILDVDVGSFDRDELVELLQNPRLKEAKKLKLGPCPYLDDSIAIIIAATMKELTNLDVSVTKITGVGVKKLVQSLPKLRLLSLRECQDVGADAVDWARAQGVECRFTFR